MTAGSGTITAPFRRAARALPKGRRPSLRAPMSVIVRKRPASIPGMATIPVADSRAAIEHRRKDGAMKRPGKDDEIEPAAGNGLLHRRALLGTAALGVVGAGLGPMATGA